MKKRKQTTIALSVCTALAAAAGTSQAGIAGDQSPFAMQDLGPGYMVAESHVEGKCGEGKCGGKSKTESKSTEGKCGEGKCGGKSEAEGKCGEGKCGGKPETEGKSTEGKCGEGKCGGKQ
jgi:uncharacterized low-complexity protein